MGKLFTSILNTRLNNFSEEYRLIKENQLGFRQNYSTIDNIFTFFSIISTNYNIHKKHPVEFGDHLLSQLTMQCHQHKTA
jgi:hypothetical protein